MKDGFLLLLIGYVVLLLQTTVLGTSLSVKPDFILITVVWSGLRLRLLTAAIYSFMMGLFMDVFSGIPTGFSSAVYSLIILAVSHYHTYLHTDSVFSRGAIIAVALTFNNLTFLLFQLTISESTIAPAFFYYFLLKLIFTTITGWIFIQVLDHIHWMMGGITGRNNTLEW